MTLTRRIQKRPRWFGYIGSSTTCPPILRPRPRTQANHGRRAAPYLGSMISRRRGYGGPCPPVGRHRYFHKLYALDITLDLRGATKSQIERAMRGHILANAELIGTYQKGDR